MDLLRTFARESSIHGLAHLVRSQHWLEKAFWLVMLVFSVVCSVSICNMHWERYQNNATVLNVETDYLSWQFRPPAATVCSDHVNEEKLDQLLQRYWNVSSNHSNYDHYRQFLLTVARVRYDNLIKFEPFINDSKLASVSVIDLARELKSPLTPPWKTFAPVLTEVGVCYSSTMFYTFQSPYSDRSQVNYTKVRPADCYTLDVCRTMVAMSHVDSIRNDVYIHIEQDIMTPDSSIHYVLGQHDIISSSLSVEQVVASKALKQLSRRRRKCRLPTERLLYFNVYTINLCRMSCRIEAALQLCDCVPFFYNIGKTSCTPAGLYCLAVHFRVWYKTNCTCQPLCESVSFKQVLVKKTVLEQANSKLETQIIYPRMRMKRDVLFDISNLIVSLGGGAALFLGCSFISFVEVIFFVLEYVIKKAYQYHHRQREPIQS
ncbi:sodium channel protein Nach [Anopheles maculipalpis]|uniref:sodium channel protein Nach n=1 Tax=Anopheles maculipalpis TaxID=1496333 RepID=UPI0021599708|nr:sodium channel protein Nach [Anopheles maculipalpis]